MSTEEDGHTLTRKQLRELRLTGSTPVVSSEDAAAAQAAQAETPSDRSAETDSVESHAAERAAAEPGAAVQASSAASSAPLTRRAARAKQRGRTDSGPVDSIAPQSAAEEPVAAQPVAEPVVAEPVVEATVVEEPVVDETVVQEPVVAELIVDVPVAEAAAAAGSVRDGSVPVFAPQPAQSTTSDAGLPSASPARDHEEDQADADTDGDADVEPERPMVGAAFGIGVKRSPSGPATPTAFDDLIDTGSGGSHKTASTLIFTPSPGAGSLSGPVASTGELLITGTYALPDGMGSQGHALGTTDGKDIDAVLIDGELAPASSPTPIAASSAISTSKPAGEVIRPPVPDKGSKLTLTLAIVAGGLALALAASLIIAFTTGVLG
ncbi:hypothetical protein [Microbacterium sp. AR7-10]|uniref:hypothetical protein n=1 Tax=Microbacterium sp. AR7-10 TaxID=1891970 RepID=UPI0008FC22D0|nr:hypothetical protein [Microbacterium sp. AR7-10]OIU84559.1 hypothetical protein BFN01_13690 [Microbacterium sp. AR7-10]